MHIVKRKQKGRQDREYTYTMLFPRICRRPNTLRCLVNAPLLLPCQSFSIPPDLIRVPHLLILKKMTFCTNSSSCFLPLLVLFIALVIAKWHASVYMLVLCFMAICVKWL